MRRGSQWSPATPSASPFRATRDLASWEPMVESYWIDEPSKGKRCVHVPANDHSLHRNKPDGGGREAGRCSSLTIAPPGQARWWRGERRGAVAHQPPFPRPPITSTTSSGASLQKQIPSSKDSFKIFVLLDLVNFSYLAVQSLEKSPTSAPCRCTPSLRLALGKNRLRPSIRLRFSEHSLNSPEFGRASFGVM